MKSPAPNLDPHQKDGRQSAAGREWLYCPPKMQLARSLSLLLVHSADRESISPTWTPPNRIINLSISRAWAAAAVPSIDVQQLWRINGTVLNPFGSETAQYSASCHYYYSRLLRSRFKFKSMSSEPKRWFVWTTAAAQPGDLRTLHGSGKLCSEPRSTSSLCAL